MKVEWIMILAVGGNRRFPNLDLVKYGLLFFLKESPDLEVRVGKAKGIDQETIKVCRALRIPYKPIPEPKDGNFKGRNRVVVRPADHFLGFNIDKWFRTGTWNAVNQFTELHPANWFVMINQHGQSWSPRELSKFLYYRSFTYRTIPDLV